jgi:hypothetical protein
LVAFEDRQSYLHGRGRATIYAETAAKANRSFGAAGEVVLHLDEGGNGFIRFVVFVDEISTYAAAAARRRRQA